jgi:ribosomal protein S21
MRLKVVEKGNRFDEALKRMTRKLLMTKEITGCV